MVQRTSSGKGRSGSKKSGQKYQNNVAYAPNKYSTVALRIAATPVQGVCRRCLDVIEWRKRMGKYKPLTQPKTCNVCHGRTIVDAYHVSCRKCATESNCCAKCQEPNEIVPMEGYKNGAEAAAAAVREAQERQAVLDKLNERQKRSYLRKLDAGDEEGAKKILARAAAIVASKGDGSDDDDDFGFSDEDDSDDDAKSEE